MASPLFWVGASFYKQTNLHIRFVLGSCKTSRSPHQPTKILEVYIESLSGFSFVYHPDGLNTQYHITVSKLCPLKMAPAMGTAGRTYIGVRVRIQGPAHRSTNASPLYDLLQHSPLMISSYNLTCSLFHNEPAINKGFH